MANTHPEIAAEFNLEKNEGVTPETIITGTHKRIWWKCQNAYRNPRGEATGSGESSEPHSSDRRPDGKNIPPVVRHQECHSGTVP